MPATSAIIPVESPLLFRTHHIDHLSADRSGLSRSKIAVVAVSEIDAYRQEGIAIGEERGIAQGEHNKALATARNLLAMRLLTPQQIAQAAGLELEEVEALAKEC